MSSKVNEENTVDNFFKENSPAITASSHLDNTYFINVYKPSIDGVLISSSLESLNISQELFRKLEQLATSKFLEAKISIFKKSGYLMYQVSPLKSIYKFYKYVVNHMHTRSKPFILDTNDFIIPDTNNSTIFIENIRNTPLLERYLRYLRYLLEKHKLPINIIHFEDTTNRIVISALPFSGPMVGSLPHYRTTLFIPKIFQAIRTLLRYRYDNYSVIQVEAEVKEVEEQEVEDIEDTDIVEDIRF